MINKAKQTNWRSRYKRRRHQEKLDNLFVKVRMMGHSLEWYEMVFKQVAILDKQKRNSADFPYKFAFKRCLRRRK